MSVRRHFDDMNMRLLFLLIFSCAAVLAADEKTTSFPPELKIITRKDWGANPPVSEMKKHELKFITIHHTGVKRKADKSVTEKLRGLQEFSQHEGTLGDGKKKPAWPDVPYHFYVTCNGEIAEAREIQYVGDTNTEYDPTGHILVCLEGNFQTEEPTEAQMKVTKALVKWLAGKYKVPADKIAAHKDYASTQCPGSNLYAKLDEIRDSAR